MRTTNLDFNINNIKQKHDFTCATYLENNAKLSISFFPWFRVLDTKRHTLTTRRLGTTPSPLTTEHMPDITEFTTGGPTTTLELTLALVMTDMVTITDMEHQPMELTGTTTLLTDDMELDTNNPTMSLQLFPTDMLLPVVTIKWIVSIPLHI